QSTHPATHCSASSGRSGTGATPPTAQRSARRAGSRTRATEAVAREGPERLVAATSAATAEHARQAHRQDLGLVARRDHHGHLRPPLRGTALRQPYVRPPEEAL